MPAACDKKRVCFSWKKKKVRLFICGSYADASDRAVFPAAVIKEKNMISTEKTPIYSIEFIKQSLKQLRDKPEIFIKEKGAIFVGKNVKDVTDLIEKLRV